MAALFQKDDLFLFYFFKAIWKNINVACQKTFHRVMHPLLPSLKKFNHTEWVAPNCIDKMNAGSNDFKGIFQQDFACIVS
jgi:hypothetical protein